MTLTLKIRNMDRLDNGMPAEFVLNRRGAMIGRAATCDWSLPDPRSYISSRHGEVTYRDGFYTFKDVSTNGTFMNGAAERMAEPRRVEQGDLFLVGHYEIVAQLSGEALAAVERHEEAAAEAAQQDKGWGWEGHGDGPAAPPPDTDRGGWGDAPANSGLSSGFGGSAAPLGDGGGHAGSDGGWGAAPAAPDTGGGWGAAPAAASGDGWAPAPSGPSLNRAEPYAQQGGGAAAPSFGGASPGGGSLGGDSWTPAAAAPPPPSPSVWDGAREPVQQASAWSSAVSDRPKQASPNDIWGSMENSNVVDWARADFGAAKPAAPADPLGLAPKPAAAALPKALPTAPGDDGAYAPTPPSSDWGAPAASDAGWGSNPASAQAPAPAAPPAARAPSPPPPSAAPAPTPAPAMDANQAVFALAAAAGLSPELLKQPSPATLERAGQIVRRLVAGLVVMVEARARAKSQMGAEQTGLEFDGNNPLKFARTPDQAIAQLLNPPERGFMPAERAIEDAFFDLQSHQMATLKAMQGALRATLDRFSPAAIKKRAESGGFMTRILPGGRDATLWQTYEREFSGVAQGSDEAFMDIFAKEFRQAYDEQSRNRKKG